MMKKIAVTKTCPAVRRFMAGLLCLAMLCGLVPAVTPGAKAAGWAQPYMDQLTEWGVLRGEEIGKDPDEFISRADYVTLLNRTFGYKLTGEESYVPFTDLNGEEWYYEDIRTAYNVGYFTGVPGSKALPNDNLTRAQAVVAVGRNLMLEEEPGEVHEFSDGRSLAPWARGMIKAAYKAELINGNPGGSFQPNRFITRGEMACLLCKAVGTLVQDEREHELGNVYGNVTINSSGVTLKNTTVAGNLYLTGGISLGEVTLDNVRVLGRIVVSGAGEAHEGDTSVTMRNVVADELVVDSVEDQFVTVKVQGISDIGKTYVRTPAYLQDMTGQNYGLKQINLEAEDSTTLQLVGNIKKVVNYTPYSQITVAQGVVNDLTVDEKAIDARLDILNGGRVKQLSLDVGTTVAGKGDIDHVDVAAGNVTVAQLPNTITVRPGLESNINGEVMDTVAADESSKDPRLLPGYPNPTNIAPTTADVVFSTNKRGTIYWVLTNLADASVSASEVINPPKTDRILASGSIPATASNTEYKATVSRLVSDGSYYVTAVLVDNRGQRSPVKVAAFTTPDNTAPAFASGYPKITLTTRDSIQVGVMPTKDCQLYYAIMNKGASAPTVAQFRAGAISGDLGHGVRDVKKNTIDVFTVNNRSLLELNDYVVYLCLVDADGGKASRVVSLNTKTADGTPPVFLSELTQNKTQATSVGMTATINEKGTIYWVAVEAGAGYPAPLPGTSVRPALDSEAAKSQVINGMNGLKSGKVSATANKPVSITISGLTAQKAYDVYYLAVDAATPTPNMSESVKKITVRTEDSTGPKVEQYFTDVNEQGLPMPETDLRLIFDESVQIHPDVDLEGKTPMLKTAYDDMAAARSAWEAGKNSGDAAKLKSDYVEKEKHFTSLMRNYLALMDGDSVNEDPVFEKTEERELLGTASKPGTTAINWDAIDWVDYRKVVVEEKDGKTTVIFKNGEAVRLKSGGTYFFRAVQISDTSSQFNRLGKTGSGSVPTTYDYRVKNSMLPRFTTATAEIRVNNSPALSANPAIRRGVTVPTGQTQPAAQVDMFFRLIPKSTGAVADSIYYDVIIWSEMSIKYDVYARVMKQPSGNEREAKPVLADNKTDGSGNAEERTILSMIGRSKNFSSASDKKTDSKMESNGWLYLGQDEITTQDGVRNGRSLNNLIQGKDKFCKLNELPEGYHYEFAIEITEVKGVSQRGNWDQRVELWIDVASGPQINLGNLATSIASQWGVDKAVQPIGKPGEFEIYHKFSNEQVPKFTQGQPTFTPVPNSSTSMEMQLQLGPTDGTVYYAIAPVTKTGGLWQPGINTFVTVTAKGENGNNVTRSLMVIPEDAKKKVVDGSGAVTQEPNVAGAEDYFNADGTAIDSNLYKPKTNGANYTLGYGVADWDPQSSTNTYSLTSPTYQEIFNQQIEGDDIMWGPKAGVKAGAAVKRVLLEGLDADTTYFIYMVVKGASDARSPVYVYQFTTPKPQKPVITLRGDRPTSGTNKNSQGVIMSTAANAKPLYWILLSQSKGLPECLTKEFEADNSVTGYKEDDYSKGADGVTGTFSVLDAILTEAKGNYNGQSVFDVWGNSTQRAAVNDLFVTGAVGSNARLYSDRFSSVTASKEQSKYFPYEDLPMTQCFFLAAAYNDEGGGWAYRGLGGIQKPNQTKPDISSAFGTFGKVFTGAQERDNRYTGQVTLTFDTGTGQAPIYYLGSTEATAVHLYNGTVPSGKDGKNIKDTGVILSQCQKTQDGGPGGTDEQSGTIEVAATMAGGQVEQILMLDFKNVREGDQVVLFGNGRITNADGLGFSGMLFIRFSSTEKGEKLDIHDRPHIEISWTDTTGVNSKYNGWSSLNPPPQ